MNESAPRQRPPDFAKIRAKHPSAYQPWTKEEDAQLLEELGSQIPVNDIARIHKRRATAIRSRIAALGSQGSASSLPGEAGQAPTDESASQLPHSQRA